MSTEEQFDIVDEHDRVIGVQSRSVVHARNLAHRAVHLFLFRSTGELLGQMRSATKDQYPSCYTSSASGHVNRGEAYDTAIAREVREELGLSLPVTFRQKFSAGPDTSFEFTALYEARTDEPVTGDPDEIAALEWRTVAEWLTLFAAHPERFSPCFVTLLRWWTNQPPG